MFCKCFLRSQTMDADKKTSPTFKHWCVWREEGCTGLEPKGDFSACEGRIPLWQPQEGWDAAAGSAGMQSWQLWLCGIWDTHSMTRFTGWEWEGDREEAAHGWTCGKKWGTARRLFQGNSSGSLTCFWNLEEVKAFLPGISPNPPSGPFWRD